MVVRSHRAWIRLHRRPLPASEERLWKQVLLAVPRTVAAVPRLVGALTAVLEQVARLASPGGELAQLLGAGARRLSARESRERPQLPARALDGMLNERSALPPTRSERVDWFV